MKALSLIEEQKANVQKRKDAISLILVELEENSIELKSMRQLSDYIAIRLTQSGDLCSGTTFRRKSSPYKHMLEEHLGIRALPVSGGNALDILKKDGEIRRLKKQVEDQYKEIIELHQELQNREVLKIEQHAAPEATIYSKSQLSKVEDELDRAYVVVVDLLRLLTGCEIKPSDGKVYETLNNTVLMDRDNFPRFFEIYTEHMEF
ncbi:hypothetical protein [Vibrio diazotrophicus]|jgi:hypothetical protein|uniref:hypothetical protein n=1 Tax=Vibrio diazotrophicus TaxID=685 RepID=UPI0005A7D694|nr:hypothetical protein [Vibrio diazotrophicus]